MTFLRIVPLLSAGLLSGCMLMHAKDGGCMSGHGEHAEAHSAVSCPVCGTELKVDPATPRASHEGRLYYFSSEDHLKQFVNQPERFIKKADAHEGHGGHR